MWQTIAIYSITGIASYLIGAIPFSYILGRVFAGIDLRKMGSGNPGATNLYRNAGPALGVPALMLDIAKGFVPVLLFAFIFNDFHLIYVAGAAAVVGHMYTIFLGFKGGKGVATSAGAMLAISWQITVFAILIFIVTVIISRYISLGSVLAALSIIVASIIVPMLRIDILGLGNYDWVLSVFCGVFGLLIIFAHRKNIVRLFKGEENKFNSKGSKEKEQEEGGNDGS